MMPFGILKQKCRRELRPILEMLSYKWLHHGEIIWMGHVKLIEESVLKNPADYLSSHYPPHVIGPIVHQLFEELIDHSVHRNKIDPQRIDLYPEGWLSSAYSSDQSSG